MRVRCRRRDPTWTKAEEALLRWPNFRTYDRTQRPILSKYCTELSTPADAMQ